MSQWKCHSGTLRASTLKCIGRGHTPIRKLPSSASWRAAARHGMLRRQRCAAVEAPEKLEAKALQPDDFMQDRMDFLRRDLGHLFDDQGIDKTAYEEKVAFQDPLTNYKTLTGYLFNIQFLRRIFGPKFILHDLRRTGEWEITSRWTMQMSLQPNKCSPLRKWWDPELLFTGVSIMSIDPDTGKFNSHIDYWDAIENQKFLSLEAVRHLASQLTTFSQAPRGLETPDYLVLRRFSDCEVRRYEPFLVAETEIEPPASDGDASSGSDKPPRSGTSAFRRLAGYIFGGNDRKESMKMTTPVFTDSGRRMQFVVGKAEKELGELPTPTEASVQLRRQGGGHFAAVSFSGRADEQQVQEELQRLRAAIAARGLRPKSDAYVVARYNDPGTKPIFRRNDVLIELESFELW